MKSWSLSERSTRASVRTSILFTIRIIFPSIWTILQHQSIDIQIQCDTQGAEYKSKACLPSSLLQGKKVSCKLRIRRKATLYSRRDPRRINDMVYIHPLMSSNPSCTLRGPAVVYSFPAAACTTAAMRRHCKSTLKKNCQEKTVSKISHKRLLLLQQNASQLKIAPIISR